MRDTEHRQNELREFLIKHNWRITKGINIFKSFMEKQIIVKRFDSINEYIYHLKNNFRVKEHICKCGSKKKFRNNPKKRYGEFCSTKCSNLAKVSDKELQKKKSNSCKKYHQGNNKSKERGKKISNFYRNLKENDPILYEEYRSKKDKTLRKIWESFSEEKLNETREKMSTSSKKWWNSLPHELQDNIIICCNKGFKNFIKNMTKEEKELYYNKAQKTRELTFQEKYGCHPNKSPKIKEKIKKTTLKKYGVEYITQHPKTREKIRKTNERKGNWITEDQVQTFKDYYKLVWRYTKQNNLSTLENFELRGHINQGGYHLDHKFSIFEGFKQNVPAEIIGNIVNLEMVTCKSNIKKNKDCSITLQQLLDAFWEFKGS